ncbi:efflux RND transporter periplasmic adaptor subunit [Nitratireductor indicus]|uniref:efflux RND transporter periplasmic adaptor subunit n=1 Tax=Nitratireductor indicus TaxID=721133 RepID=UPI0028768467|nr:efflux RND transporter periplasmic adaptor subunit [Nitratireductor indicus]MDS1135664.1 efflux RND transporter periplasmic adaptor subunit [Nitratireductor indicus]
MAFLLYPYKIDEAPATYRTMQVYRGELTARIATTATLRPLTEVSIASGLSGMVKDVPVRENQRIKRGDVLIRLDARAWEFEVQSAEAAMKVAEAQLSAARTTLEEGERRLQRALALSAGQAITDRQKEEAEAERNRAFNRVEVAEAEMAMRRATLKLRQYDLSRVELRSPIDGIVLARKADPGQTVIAAAEAPALFTLAEDLQRMELIARINEADIGEVTEGQKAVFTVDAFPGRSFQARLRDVSFAHKTENNIVTYEARLDVDNGELLLRPGMTASVSITTGEARDTLLVNSSALRFRPDDGKDAEPAGNQAGADGARALLYRLKNGAPEPVAVEIGISDWDKTQIVSGLSEGDVVITGVAEGAR